MCHFLPVHHLGIAFFGGPCRRSKHNNKTLSGVSILCLSELGKLQWRGTPSSSSSSCAFLTTPLYRSSLPAGPQGYIPYPHRAAVCRCELVALTLLGHVKGFIRVHHLWARPYFSSSVLHVLVRLTLIVFVMGGKWPYSCCFVGCCLQDLFNIAHSILV